MQVERCAEAPSPHSCSWWLRARSFVCCVLGVAMARFVAGADGEGKQKWVLAGADTVGSISGADDSQLWGLCLGLLSPSL